MRRLSLLMLVVLLLLPLRSEAILGIGDAVYDVAVHFESITTALMTTQTVVNQVLDLTPLDGLAMGSEWAADLETLEGLVQEAAQLGYDSQSMAAMVRSLFALESAPSTTTELQQQLWAIRRQVSTAYSYAIRTHALITTATRTVHHLLSIYDQATQLIGNLQGHQNLSQSLAKLVQLQTETKVTSTAFERAQSLDRLTEPLILESLERINTNIMRTHPR